MYKNLFFLMFCFSGIVMGSESQEVLDEELLDGISIRDDVLVRELINRGANVNSTCWVSKKMLPLDVAASKVKLSLPSTIETIKLLKEHGAMTYKEFKTKKSEDAKHLDVAKRMLEIELMGAIGQNKIEEIQALIDKGANPNSEAMLDDKKLFLDVANLDSSPDGLKTQEILKRHGAITYQLWLKQKEKLISSKTGSSK